MLRRLKFKKMEKLEKDQLKKKWENRAFVVGDSVYKKDQDGDWLWDTLGCFICFFLGLENGQYLSHDEYRLIEESIGEIIEVKEGSFFPIDHKKRRGIEIENKPSVFVEGDFSGEPSANDCFLASEAGKNYVASAMRQNEKESKKYEGKFMNPHNTFWDANPKNGMIS